MHKLHYPRHIGSKLKEPPIFKMCFFVLRGLIPHGTIFKLQEFEPKFKNVLGYESGVHLGLIYEKTRGQKSRTFKHKTAEWELPP